MKRAVVWKSTVSELWHYAPDPDLSGLIIPHGGVPPEDALPTHEEALHAALVAVGLERQESRR